MFGKNYNVHRFSAKHSNIVKTCYTLITNSVCLIFKKADFSSISNMTMKASNFLIIYFYEFKLGHSEDRKQGILIKLSVKVVLMKELFIVGFFKFSLGDTKIENLPYGRVSTSIIDNDFKKLWKKTFSKQSEILSDLGTSWMTIYRLLKLIRKVKKLNQSSIHAWRLNTLWLFAMNLWYIQSIWKK